MPSKLMTRVRFPSPAPFFSNTCGIVIPCTRAIFDDHWLPKCSVQMFGHDAGQTVSRAAGSKWHHEYNRSIGVRRTCALRNGAVAAKPAVAERMVRRLDAVIGSRLS